MSHQCFVCGKNFSRRLHLERHSWTHSQIKPFQCHYCGDYFTQKGSLDRHILTHDIEKPYQCSLCAEFKCKNPKDLEDHYETCEGKKFKCNLCPSTFSSKSGIWSHMNSRHPTTFHFQCAHCNRPPFLTQEIFELHFERKHKDLEKGKFLKVQEMGKGQWMEQVVNEGMVTWKAVEKVENKKDKRKRERKEKLAALNPMGDLLEPITPLVNELPPIALAPPPLPPFPFMMNLQTLINPVPLVDNNANRGNSKSLVVADLLDYTPLALEESEPLCFDLEVDNNDNGNNPDNDTIHFGSVPLSVQSPRSIGSPNRATVPDDEMWFNLDGSSRPESALTTNLFSPPPLSRPTSRFEGEELCLSGLMEY